ncbi:dihydroxyacetone kinase phosphoryl donor subunit DhaM [Kallipyga massiliensis]|uniref:dihydroxyacetone kinase phosphoryl donor subunit DhaM n=1 Tax=Kallipyga massiliensis TaxID=1472764 RepID=UPI0026EF9F44|nr:dihydroxyacetone kinase phosphoryl donor subunit DhaM [Kallipyga massiliensis]
MVEFLILSHSKNLAQGVKELAEQMAPDVPIQAIGGDSEGNLGSDGEKIIQAISQAGPEGLFVLFDMGSSMMNAQMALEMVDPEVQDRVFLADLPLVEGAVQTAVMAQGGDDFQALKAYAQENKAGKLF